MPLQEIRDPVHGYINLDEEEIRLINTPVFQRLRRIKQLALTNLVYPGATHTRFSHSLGVAYLASKLANKLLDIEEEKHLIKIIRYSSLLHDIGHGPFSHVSDFVFENLGYKKDFHETIGRLIIKSNDNIMKHMSDSLREDILRFLDISGKPTFAKCLISGPLDCDKQDYFLRDSLFCGVKYGIFDIDRLHESLVCIEDPSYDDKYLGIKEDGIGSIEQFILAKHYLTSQIYFHRVRLITDQMLIRAILLGIEEEKTFLKDIYTFTENDSYMENYLEWDDNRLTYSIMLEKQSRSFKLFSRIFERRLLKQVFHAELSSVFNPDSRRKLSETSYNQRRDIERRIANIFDWDQDEVILNIYPYRIKKHEEQMQENEEILIKTNSPQPSYLENESSLYKAVLKSEERFFCDIYAPITWSYPQEKGNWERKNTDKILQTLQT
jgi:hypothetical protein